jgi:hypothetical protein
MFYFCSYPASLNRESMARLGVASSLPPCHASLMAKLLLLLSALFATAGPHSRYAEGQVWEYKARPQDTGSLVKIQKIEDAPAGTIYHISLIGIHLTSNQVTELQHAPVSQQTLDTSVTKQVADPGTFPDANDGIAEWRRANGGVFTISLAQIADVLDQTAPEQQQTPIS